jgi:hypothetical protein
LIEDLELAPEIGSTQLTCHQGAVAIQCPGNSGAILVDELNAESADSEGE